jgi:hypothetical protein
LAFKVSRETLRNSLDSFSVLAVILFRHMDLVTAARQGKQAAFLQLYDEHHLPLFRFAHRLTGSVADAEDILQECFLGLLRPECSFDPSRTELRRYLFGAVRNQALKRLRLREGGGRGDRASCELVVALGRSRASGVGNRTGTCDCPIA